MSTVPTGYREVTTPIMASSPYRAARRYSRLAVPLRIPAVIVVTSVRPAGGLRRVQAAAGEGQDEEQGDRLPGQQRPGAVAAAGQVEGHEQQPEPGPGDQAEGCAPRAPCIGGRPRRAGNQPDRRHGQDDPGEFEGGELLAEDDADDRGDDARQHPAQRRDHAHAADGEPLVERQHADGAPDPAQRAPQDRRGPGSLAGEQQDRDDGGGQPDELRGGGHEPRVPGTARDAGQIVRDTVGER